MIFSLQRVAENQLKHNINDSGIREIPMHPGCRSYNPNFFWVVLGTHLTLNNEKILSQPDQDVLLQKTVFID